MMNPKNLSVIAYANGFTLWHYLTGDTAVAVKGANYFNSASDLLRQGDFVFVNAALNKSQIHAVTGNTNGVVTVAEMALPP